MKSKHLINDSKLAQIDAEKVSGCTGAVCTQCAGRFVIC